MKPRLEPLSHRTNNRSFVCYEVVVPSFEFSWHYHPEYELTYIVAGTGKRLIGDGYEPFQEGDFVMLPPMLPHTWVSEKKEATKDEKACKAIVIQFSQEFVAQLLQFSELQPLKKLFANASRGLYFPLSENNDLPMLQQILQDSEVTGFATLLAVLNQLGAKKAIPIASLPYKPMKGNENQQRVNKIFKYVQAEFNSGITVEKAAALVHLSESAFCKFFKRASGKTFSDYTNEIRIAHACHLLLETDQPISEIAFHAGFESLTYFNRVFLKKKKMTPGEYRKR